MRLFNNFKSFKSWVRNTKQGFINLWKWKSIIWNDRYWDYTYLLIMLKFKLKDKSEGFKRTQILSNWDTVSSKLDEIVNWIDLYQNEFDDVDLDLYITSKEFSIWCKSKAITDNQLSRFEEGYKKRACMDKYRKKIFIEISNNIESWWD